MPDTNSISRTGGLMYCSQYQLGVYGDGVLAATITNAPTSVAPRPTSARSDARDSGFTSGRNAR